MSMKARLTALAACILAIGVGGTFAQAQQPDQSGNEELIAAYENGFRQRRLVLEDELGLQFDSNWRPRVTLDTDRSKSAGTSQKEDCFACYFPDTQEFGINPHYMAGSPATQPIDWDVLAGQRVAGYDHLPITRVVDHELGHRFADETRRRLGLGQFPAANVNELPLEERLCVKLTSEGLAMYIEQHADYDWLYLPDDSVWPISRSDPRWGLLLQDRLFYPAGLKFVAPILDFDFHRGLEYLVSHPLTCSDGDLFGAVRQYYKDAMKALNIPYDISAISGLI